MHLPGDGKAPGQESLPTPAAMDVGDERAATRPITRTHKTPNGTSAVKSYMYIMYFDMNIYIQYVNTNIYICVIYKNVNDIDICVILC